MSDGVQERDRYAYADNNRLKYNDQGGRWVGYATVYAYGSSVIATKKIICYKVVYFINNDLDNTSKMERIKIQLKTSTDKGRLLYIPDLDFEPYGLYIQDSQNDNDFISAHFININSVIIIYLYKDFIIQSVDFNIPRKFWKFDSTFVIPTPKKEQGIQIINVSKKHETFDAPITVITDEDFYWVCMYWVDSLKDGEWISISEQVLILVHDNHLNGFFIKLK